MAEHLRTDYDRMVGESYKEYASRMRGWALAAEHDQDVLTAEVRELRELADDVRRAWVAMPPNPRMAVRSQSEELYNALGVLSTYVMTRGHDGPR